jgi:hypothetical protein
MGPEKGQFPYEQKAVLLFGKSGLASVMATTWVPVI